MWMNRLPFRALDEPVEVREFYMVRAACGYFFVSQAAARELLILVHAWLRPRFVRFRDLSGADINLATDSIQMIAESTPDQRAFDRQLHRMLEEEAGGGAPWSDVPAH